MKRTLSNCFLYAFDRVHQHGGYICFGMSTHATPPENWNMQHLANYDNIKQELTAFVPPADLAHPAKSLFIFPGMVVVGDAGYRRPMTKGEMAKGIFVSLPLAFTVWLAKRWYDAYRGKK